MSFVLRLVTDVAQVEPGSSGPVAIEVTSRGNEPVQLELALEGLDAQWAAVPVPTFTLEPGTSRTERVFLKPPRESSSIAGNYPFVLRVRDLETGESQSVQGLLEIKSFHYLSLDAQPKKATISAGRKDVQFQVSAMNLGNLEESLTFFATDTDDNFAYEFEPDQVTIGAGQQKTVLMKASATKSSLLANSRLHAVTITSRSTTTPAVAANCTAQIEQKALVSPGTALLGLIIALIAGLWFAFLPKPPLVTTFASDKRIITLGETVTLTWAAANATSVTLDLAGNKESMLPERGTRTITPDKPGTINIFLEAVNGSHKSTPTRLVVEVKPKVTAPAPEITEMKVANPKVRLGSTFRISYKFNEHVVSATLSPTNQTLDPRGDGVEVQATTLGRTPYKIIARNADGVPVERIVLVDIERISLAAAQLVATPKVLEPGGGTVRITWTVSNAARGEIKIGNQTQAVDLAAGGVEVFVDKTTEITLIVYDAEGVPRTDKVTVTVKQPPAPIDPASTTGGATGSTTGVSPSTTGATSGPVTPPGP